MTEKQDQPSSDIAFTPAVKAVQKRKGSRLEFLEQEAQGGWNTSITPSLVEFISQITTCYLSTATAEGQPYVQHRGGPPGFLQVLDSQTLGFADFPGNRQYVTTGNLEENPRAFLFLMDYTRNRRVKLWGTARIVENDPDLIDRLLIKSYPADVEQVVLFSVKAWDVNCPRHIPTMVPMEEVSKLCQRFETRIEELERENASLKEGAIN